MNPAYPLLYGTLWGASHALSPFSPKVREWFHGRKGWRRRYEAHAAALGSGAFWFHVASAGELEQALGILEELRRQSPQTKVFLSYFSPSARRAVERQARREPLWDRHDYLPADFPSNAHFALRTLRPRALVLIHRELWPGLLGAAEALGVPLHLVASQGLQGKHEPRLRPFRSVGTIDRPTLAVPHYQGGDPRVDRVLSRRRRSAPPSALLRWAGTQPIVLGASLWEEDFAALEPSVGVLREVRWVLVPHEPSAPRLRHWETKLSRRGVQSVRWSTLKEGTGSPAPVVLVDTVGELMELYGGARLVVMGGSFKGRIHNVLEPAAYGLPLVCGPHIGNSWEAQALAAGEEALMRVDSSQGLPAALTWGLEPGRAQSAAQALERFFETHRGAGDTYARHLLTGGK